MVLWVNILSHMYVDLRLNIRALAKRGVRVLDYVISTCLQQEERWGQEAPQSALTYAVQE